MRQHALDMPFLEGPTSALKTGFRTFMPTCRQVSKLQCDALDGSLSWPTRIGLRLHLLVCQWCRRYGKQIRLLHQAARERSGAVIDATPHRLSPEARERLSRSLREGPE